MASEAEDDSEAAAEEPPALSDSGLEESATEFEFSRPSPPTLTIDEDSLDGLEAIALEDQNGGDEGVGESDETFDDTMGMFYLMYNLKCINHLKILKYFFQTVLQCNYCPYSAFLGMYCFLYTANMYSF